MEIFDRFAGVDAEEEFGMVGGGGDAESKNAEDGFGVSDDGGAGAIEAGGEGTVRDG
jgi:hypothetical protein